MTLYSSVEHKRINVDEFTGCSLPMKMNRNWSCQAPKWQNSRISIINWSLLHSTSLLKTYNLRKDCKNRVQCTVLLWKKFCIDLSQLFYLHFKLCIELCSVLGNVLAENDQYFSVSTDFFSSQHMIPCENLFTFTWNYH